MDGASRSYVSPERVHYNVDGGTVKAGPEQGYCISGQHDSMTSRGHVLERGGPLQGFRAHNRANPRTLRKVRKPCEGRLCTPAPAECESPGSRAG